MPVCEICTEEFTSEADMKTHLLLDHLEREMSCPLCPLSGVSYDELHFHIATAHEELDFHHTPAADHKALPPRPTDLEMIRTGGTEGTSKDSLGVQHSGVTHEMPAPSTGTALTQVAATRADASPPAAGTPTESEKQTSARSMQGPGTRGQARHQDTVEHRKSKQKRLTSPKKEKEFSCPMCSLVCTDCFVLQEHVELHLQDQSICEGVRQYSCPLCSVVCADSSSLQEHVELHLECGASAAEGDSSEDLRMARQLQEEEELRRREEDAKREAEDFKKLQRLFGMDNSGGYRKQMEKTMEKAVSRGHMAPAEFHRKRVEMLESMALGVDDGRTRTTGLLPAFYEHFQRETRNSAHVWLCADTDHYSASDGDKGWGCGYRNFQMLLSSLQRMEQYTALNTLPDSVPSIPRVQALIEAAWTEGMDPQGATHFNGRLQGTRAWIGATEIYAVLTAHRLRARVVDFHKPTGPGNTHPRLFEWVKNYFSNPSSRGARLAPRVVKTALPPIYLQHQGHSRTIVGVEEKLNGNVCLLLLDPGCPAGEVRKLLSPNSSAATANRMRKFPSHLKHTQYQVVVVEGVLSPEEKQTCILNSRTLRAERIP